MGFVTFEEAHWGTGIFPPIITALWELGEAGGGLYKLVSYPKIN
jgi:hypothetical protein